LVSFAFDALVSFSVLPLRIAAYVGGVLTILLALIGAYAIISWLVVGTAPGWASLTLLVAVVSAIQLLVLGVIGEYVGRIYLQSKQRPLFLIAELRRSPLKDSPSQRERNVQADKEP
jgi:dolichol-phosphate mannosyltransferase